MNLYLKSLIKPILLAAIFIFSTLSLIQCKKESPPTGDSSFVIGKPNPTYYSIQTSSPPLEIHADPHSSINLEFDVNGDGLNDFDLISNHPISPGGVNYSYSAINPLHCDFEISFTQIPDTSFRCITGSNYGGDSVVNITYYNSDTLFDCSVDDTITAIYLMSYPEKWEYGSVLSDEIIWTNEEINFGRSDYSSSYSFENNIIYSYSSIKKRSNWNGLPVGYLLFRLKSGVDYKYGWIKLEVFEYKGMRIYEIVIQK